MDKFSVNTMETVMEVNVEDISKEELVRVVCESQKYVSELADKVREKDYALEQVTRQLNETREELRIAALDRKKPTNAKKPPKPCLDEEDDPGSQSNEDAEFLIKIEKDDDDYDPKKPVKRKKRGRGRPRKIDKNLATTVASGKKRSEGAMEVTEIDTNVDSLITENNVDVDGNNEMYGESFESITVFNSEEYSLAREYIATIVGPTAICHICESVFLTLSKIQHHYREDHCFDICMDIEDTTAKRCTSCDKWYVNIHDLHLHQAVIHKRRAFVKSKGSKTTKEMLEGMKNPECLAAYDSQGTLMTKLSDKSKTIIDLKIDLVKDVDSSLVAQEKKSASPYYVPRKPFKFTCHYCSSRFRERAQGEAHIRRDHFNIKNCFICSICGKATNSRTNYLSHSQTHSESTPIIICHICGKIFANHHNMKRHQQSNHTSQRPFLCSTCGMDFAQRSTLDYHLRSHGYKEKYRCGYCCRGYKSAVKLREHLEKKHQQIQTFICFICDEEHITDQDLRKHFTSHTNVESSTSGKAYKCNICKYETFLPIGLRNHIRAHKRGKTLMHYQYPHSIIKSNRMQHRGPFICRFCEKRCSGKDYLDLHEFKHTRVKKFSCTRCDRKFTMEPQLRSHIATRHDGHRYPCTICGKQFTILGNIQRHINEVHGKSRRFKCDVCNKSFAQKQSLMAHEETIRHKEKVDVSKGIRRYYDSNIIDSNLEASKSVVIEADTGSRVILDHADPTQQQYESIRGAADNINNERLHAHSSSTSNSNVSYYCSTRNKATIPTVETVRVYYTSAGNYYEAVDESVTRMTSISRQSEGTSYSYPSTDNVVPRANVSNSS